MNRSIACILLAAAVATASAIAGPLTQDPCSGTTTTPAVWKQIGRDSLESLLFSDGSLWVGDTTAGRIVRFGADGGEVPGGSLDGVSPGGMAEGPDGLIYAGNGNSIPDSLLRRGASKVVRFDPSDPPGTVSTYAQGFDMANGLTFGPGDDIFISNDVGRGLIRIPRADPVEWELFADVWGTNGLVVDPSEENLYAAITFDQRSSIERIPLDDPASHETAAVLTLGVVSLEPAVYTPDTSKPLIGVKGLDDMTRSDDGSLYVVANGLGELLRVDPLTGEACLVAGGFDRPASVRIAPAGSPFDVSGEALTFYVVEFSGAIRVLGYTPG